MKKNVTCKYSYTDKLPATTTSKSLRDTSVILMRRPKYIQNTPPKTNMSPENQWLEDAFPIKMVPFKGTCWFSGKPLNKAIVFGGKGGGIVFFFAP